MIEKRLKSELSVKRWRKFKRDKFAVVSCWIVGLLCFLALTAELWANSKPILLFYSGKLYIPAYWSYHPEEFGRSDIFIMDYRNLQLSRGDWALWPLVKWNPIESNRGLDRYPAPPSLDNWLGTDDRGRDILARIIYGFRYSFTFALGVWLMAYTIGTILGAALGYFGGWLDLIVSRIVEIVQELPVLLILITLIAFIKPSLWILIPLSAIFGWTGIFHYMRAEFLRLRKREFVEAAKAIGCSTPRIIFKHILPNALTPIFTFSPFTIAAGVTTLTVLDYLGLGLPPPTPSWGELISQAQKYVTFAPWLSISPAVAIALTTTSLIAIGQAIRDVFDSRI
jgi:microcin C transport system permease protein